MIGLIPKIVNGILLLIYFVLHLQHRTSPEEFRLVAWIMFAVYLYLDHFADGLQNTTRNIARIHMLQKHGIASGDKDIVSIQLALTPNYASKLAFVYMVSEVFSFALLLTQGWIVALAVHASVFLFAGFIPLNYKTHLKRVQAQIKNLDANAVAACGLNSADLKALSSIVSYAISENLNPQDWWGKANIKASYTKAMRDEEGNGD